jgi:hypothetical protein
MSIVIRDHQHKALETAARKITGEFAITDRNHKNYEICKYSNTDTETYSDAAAAAAAAISC